MASSENTLSPKLNNILVGSSSLLLILFLLPLQALNKAIKLNVVAYDEYKSEGEKSITFALTYLDENKTLTEEEVMQSFNNMIEAINKKFNSKIKNM